MSGIYGSGAYAALMQQVDQKIAAAEDRIGTKNGAVVEDFYVAGEVDAAPMFNRAIASGAKRIKAQGSYLLGSAPVQIASGLVFDLAGASFTTTSTSAQLFNANSVDDWAIEGPFTITGPGGSGGTAIAMRVAGCNRWRIAQPIIKNMNGWGIKNDNGTFSGSARGDQGQVIAPQIHGCSVGYEDVPGAEYCTIDAPMITGCQDAMILAAGNTIVVGGNVVDNQNGVKLMGGSNHGHGSIVGTNINHNTVYNLQAQNVTNGFSIVNCHLYGSGGASGAIWLNNSKGITFDGGHLDCWIYNYAGADSGYNFVRNMYCPGSYGDIERLETDSSVPSQLIVMGCSGPGAYKAGTTINDPAMVYVAASRDVNAKQVLSSGDTLIFPTVNNAIGDRRRAYNPTTGVFTVPAGMAGMYRVVAHLVFSGTAMSAPDSYVELGTNGVRQRIYLLSPYGTTVLTGIVNTDVYLNAGDTLKLTATIAGTAGSFGSTSWMPSLCIQRLA